MSLIIIGGGPAGLMSAISAAESGEKDITIFEQLPKLGRRLLSSGGGRCNLTNLLPINKFLPKFGKEYRFMHPAFRTFSPDDLTYFFTEKKIEFSSEDNFHIFPKSGSASDILDALICECRKNEVTFFTGHKVESLIIDKQVIGISTSSEKFFADKVIIATGGKSYPDLGGGISGYALAESAGHTIKECFPGLAGLITSDNWPKRCTGIALRDIEISIDLPKYKKRIEQGDLLFTHNGISGIPTINLSADVAELLSKNEKVTVKINITPDMNYSDWKKQIQKWRNESGKKQIKNILTNFVTKKMSSILLDLIGVPEDKEVSQLSKKNEEVLINIFTNMHLSISGTEDFDKAMVTRGGVNLKEVDSKTLESKLVKGLFFAGETLDLDGPCGGFNLQWAFSSGYLAGLSS